ncbi:MAG: DUF5654 family protein [Candidatus Daviesbacteria bacterium]|nr:DUF5654 family protein [Candidatus Daviesbacteria bacterium]
MAKKNNRQFIFHKELVRQLITLSTSAFGLAAALAWNETIQQTVKEFIEPRLPGLGILSRFIYALLVTILGIIITFELTRLAQRWGLKK